MYVDMIISSYMSRAVKSGKKNIIVGVAKIYRLRNNISLLMQLIMF